MELRHIRYFLAVERERHFGRAAKDLHIVQSALSMQISALEDELGGKLFDRTSRKVELTEAGKLFKIEAMNTISQAERAKTVVQNSLKGVTGSIRIGYVSNAVISNSLTTHFKAFHAKFPNVEITLSEVAPSSFIDLILKDKIDLAYAPDILLPEDCNLSQKYIDEWPLVIAISQEHALASLEQISLDLIKDQPLIVFPQHEANLQLEKHFNQKPIIAHQGNTALSILALAASNLGIAIVPQPLACISMPNLLFRPIEHNQLQTQLSCIYRSQETNGAVKAYVANI